MDVSQDGQTPLHGAVGRGEVKMIKALCNHMYGRPPRSPLAGEPGGVATEVCDSHAPWTAEGWPQLYSISARRASAPPLVS